jgi:hypothetical protein
VLGAQLGHVHREVAVELAPCPAQVARDDGEDDRDQQAHRQQDGPTLAPPSSCHALTVSLQTLHTQYLDRFVDKHCMERASPANAVQAGGMALVPTGVAARELGVNATTLQRWVKAGLVKPDLVTPGGHLRWDLDRLRAELRSLRERPVNDD